MFLHDNSVSLMRNTNCVYFTLTKSLEPILKTSLTKYVTFFSMQRLNKLTDTQIQDTFVKFKTGGRIFVEEKRRSMGLLKTQGSL